MAGKQGTWQVEGVDVKAQERERDASMPTEGQLLRDSCTLTPSMQTVSQPLALTRILHAPAALSMATAVSEEQLQSVTTSPPSKLVCPYAHVHSAAFSLLCVLFASAAMRCVRDGAYLNAT